MLTHAGRRKRAAISASVAAILVAAVATRLYFARIASDPRSALLSAERRATDSPNSFQAHLALGIALIKAGRSAQADSVFATAQALDPASAQPYVWRGMLAVQQNRTQDAERLFRSAAERAPPEPDVWRALAELQERIGHRNAAISSYAHATALQPDDAVAWRRLGFLELGARQYAGGHAALLRATSLDPNNADGQLGLGEVCLTEGELEPAKRALEAGLGLKPGDPQGLANLADVDLQMDSTPIGLAHAENVLLSTDPARRGARGLYVLGRIHLMQKKYERASAELLRAAAADPTLTQAYVFLSQAYAAQGKLDLARRAGSTYEALQSRSAKAVAGAVAGQQR